MQSLQEDNTLTRISNTVLTCESTSVQIIAIVTTLLNYIA